MDHQTLSFDAYVKFIEDDFLGGQRLDPKTDGRPDPRPGVRETQPILSDLAADFDFNQPPRAPVVLSVRPTTTLTGRPVPAAGSGAPGGAAVPAVAPRPTGGTSSHPSRAPRLAVATPSQDGWAPNGGRMRGPYRLGTVAVVDHELPLPPWGDRAPVVVIAYHTGRATGG